MDGTQTRGGGELTNGLEEEMYARDIMGFRDTHDIIHMLILYADSGVVPPMFEHGRPYRLSVGVQDQPHSAGCRAR